MRCSMRGLVLIVFAVAVVGWLGGCSSGTKPASPAKTPKETHKDDHGKKEDGKKDDHAHDKKLTEKDVKMPGSFKEGVERLEELQRKIHHQIEDNELKHVHRTAEEMRLVALKTKELAQKDVTEDRLAEAGKACNEIAASFEPIDKAADGGKKAEVEALHKNVGDAIKKLKVLVK